MKTVEIKSSVKWSDCPWHRPPADLLLGHREVHLWFAALDLAAPIVERLERTLSAQERIRSGQFHFKRDRSRFIARRAILRMLISRYTGENAALVQFEVAPAGKPHLADHSETDSISFSTSHSMGAALLGFVRGRSIGVDLEGERHIPDRDQLVDSFFSSREKEAYFSLPLQKRRQAFFRWWVGKEAFLKATGDGLSRGLDQFDIFPGPGTRLSLHWVNWDPAAPDRWSLENLTMIDKFAAAVAVEKKPVPGHNGRNIPIKSRKFAFHLDDLAEMGG
jgi:4'-phosphopantetheinyl transferase